MLDVLRGKPARSVVPTAALVLFLAACGGGGNAGTAGSEEVTGSIAVSGSSTVEPISVAVAEKFVASQPNVEISVEGPGTGDGFESFCNGEIDIADASRPIDPDEEVPLCEENGVEFIELKVAIDGLSVITSPENDAVSCLDFLDLYALLGAESEGFDNWSDANDLAAEIDAPNAPYPDAALDVTAPGEESGTYDSFVEIVMEDFAVDERDQPEDGPFTRADYQASANDNVIVEGIGGSPSSLGWVGFAFAVQNPDAIKTLQISHEAEGVGCVAPEPETISSGEYPIARDLFIYVNKSNLAGNDALRAYVDYYLSDEGIASATEVGYVALATDSLEKTRRAWESEKTGTRES